MIMQNKRGQNTHGQGERVKIPLLPYNVVKKSVNDSGPTVGSRQVSCWYAIYRILICKKWQYQKCLQLSKKVQNKVNVSVNSHQISTW